jgi:hypothetical protein
VGVSKAEKKGELKRERERERERERGKRERGREREAERGRKRETKRETEGDRDRDRQTHTFCNPVVVVEDADVYDIDDRVAHVDRFLRVGVEVASKLVEESKRT